MAHTDTPLRSSSVQPCSSLVFMAGEASCPMAWTNKWTASSDGPPSHGPSPSQEKRCRWPRAHCESNASATQMPMQDRQNLLFLRHQQSQPRHGPGLGLSLKRDDWTKGQGVDRRGSGSDGWDGMGWRWGMTDDRDETGRCLHLYQVGLRPGLITRHRCDTWISCVGVAGVSGCGTARVA